MWVIIYGDFFEGFKGAVGPFWVKDEAEEYMETRRQVFWDHGHRDIRRINQAYFAFYGAYADSPRGEAGEDPIGEAVRAVWDQTQDPAEFLRKMAWVTTLQQVKDLLES